MRKIIFIGRSGVGKTTLKQALKKEKIQYQKPKSSTGLIGSLILPGNIAKTKTSDVPLGYMATKPMWSDF